MLLYKGDDGMFFRTQKEASERGNFTAVNVPTDQRGLCDFLNGAGMATAAVEKSYIDMTWEERLTIALRYLQNLRTAAVHRGDREDYYIQCAENLLLKVREGIELNKAQSNLASMIYDAARRRANFSSLPDHGC